MKYLLEGQETERLRFRLLQEGDFNEWMCLFQEDKVAMYLGMDPSLDPNGLCELWFSKVFNRYENGLGGMNVLIDKQTDKFIGQCGLLIQDVEDEKLLEIGYSILPEYWGQGYASEAACKCKNYSFENHFSESLISIVHIENKGSEKVALKNGMSLERNLESYHGNPVNIFSIDRDNWKSQK